MSVKLLSDYASSKQLSLDTIESLPVVELAKFIRKFYAEIRQTSGALYAKKSMITIRYGIQKHINKVQTLDIVSNPEFKQANEVFQGMLVKLKSEGKGFVKHKDPLNQDDLLKLYASFDISTPTGLQDKVFVESRVVVDLFSISLHIYIYIILIILQIHYNCRG